jgi:hypothetical protein
MKNLRVVACDILNSVEFANHRRHHHFQVSFPLATSRVNRDCLTRLAKLGMKYLFHCLIPPEGIYTRGRPISVNIAIDRAEGDATRKRKVFLFLEPLSN